MSMGFIVSILKGLDWVNNKAKQVTYPYLLCLGEKDIIVNNRRSKEWHAKTSSKVKQMRLFAGAYHLLAKEPDNHKFFEATLRFMGERLVGKAPQPTPAKPFKFFDHATVKYYKPTPLIKRRKFWVFLLGLLYIAIGVIFALGRHKKRFLITWPKLLKN